MMYTSGSQKSSYTEKIVKVATIDNYGKKN